MRRDAPAYRGREFLGLHTGHVTRTLFSVKTIGWGQIVRQEGLQKEIKMAGKNTKKPAGQQPKPKASAEKQAKLLQRLGADARKAVAWINHWFQKDNVHTLLSRYRLGQRVKAIHDLETDQGRERYGKGTITKLANAFAWDRGILYGALALSRAYSEAEIKKLSQRRRADQQCLSFSHVRVLAEVEDKKRRSGLVDKALDECLTVAELAEAVQRETGDKAVKKQGRKLVVPKNLSALLRQQDHVVEEFLRRDRAVWSKPNHSLVHEATRMPADQLTAEDVRRLKKHAERLREMSQRAKEQAEEAERAHAYLQDRLDKARQDHEQQSPSPPTTPSTSEEDVESPVNS
jgi:hypothetical protein